MKRASTWLGPGALPSALSRADWRSCMEYCWTLVQAPSGTRGMWRLRTAWKPGRATGRLSYSSRQKARTANITSWASVRSVWVLGTRTFQRPDGPGASTSMAPRTAFHRWAMVGGVAAPEILDGALAVCRQECAELADVLFEGGCLPLQFLL